MGDKQIEFLLFPILFSFIMIKTAFAANQKEGNDMKIDSILKQRPTLSFEIFPPKGKDGDIEKIYQTIDDLAQLKPDFISVTYGAGGSTTRNTVEIASLIKKKYQIESVAHLSCIDTTREQIDTVLTQLYQNGIENILALRGDYPEGYDRTQTIRDFNYASDLDSYIRSKYPDTFCLSGACYPEVHEEAASLKEDLAHLKTKVDAGASYLVTQIFFDNRYYYRLLREARAAGIQVPILAGIMPAINAKQLLRIAKMSSCSIPYELSAMIERFANHPQAMREVGLNYAAYQIMDLITNGVDGIHIYTMNRPSIAREIIRRCDSILKGYRNVAG